MWLVAALAATAALGLGHGFDRPLVSRRTLDIVLVAAVGLFVLSRVLMILPLRLLVPRLRRCWADVVVLVGAAITWWATGADPVPSVILRFLAGYLAVMGALSAARGLLRWLTAEPGQNPPIGIVRRAIAIGVIMSLVGGFVLWLPLGWKSSHPATWENTYQGQVAYEMTGHGLNCLLTATAALTGTGLSVHSIGVEFNRTGCILILVLMQIGALATVVVGSVAGWRLRMLLNWHCPEDDASSATLRRLVVFVTVIMLFIEAAAFGGLLLLSESDPSASMSDRALSAGFRVVSAFGNVGLTGNDDSLISEATWTSTYAVVLPLLVLGGIGGPVAYDLFRRLFGRVQKLSKHTWIVLGLTLLLTAAGTGLVYLIESTPRLQERIPRADVPERLRPDPVPDADLSRSRSRPEEARSPFMRHQRHHERLLSALFQSVAARTGGFQSVRLDASPDEPAISPSTRLVLLLLMLIGGAVGGTAGGLRLTFVVVLLGSLVRRSPRFRERRIWQPQVLAPAATCAVSLLAIIFAVTLVLTYRSPESMESCVSEAVSACCNVGFTTGLTESLRTEDRLSGPVAIRYATRIAITLGMLLGRVLPLALLLRCVKQPER